MKLTSLHPAQRSAPVATTLQSARPNQPESWDILGLMIRVSEWRMRAHTRAQLARLSPERWADLGLNEASVHEELNKSFWQE